MKRCFWAFPIALAACGGSEPSAPRLVLAATHTLEDSGILDSITAGFRAAHPEHDLQVVLAGSGEVLALGRRGDADVLLTHAPADEEEFVRAGYGMDRHRVMHNDFVLLGPPADPAGAASAESAAEALARIRAAGAGFVSRGDDSGTHKKERQLWAALGVTPDWPDYVEAGVGMADAMRLTAQRGAYILADRATYLNLRHELGFGIVHEGDPSLLNQYSVMVISNPRNPAGAGALVEWITGPEARRLIGEYGRARHGGARSFWPDSADLP